ncbi:MAG TPA: hypothetical protein VLD18_13570, partial [Verrucomicrobiae bacterium]|nr:hypothetical protein [Verrucomicrobiae bacterium]
TVSFLAMTNRTYSLEYRDSLQPGLWTRLRDVEAAPISRIVEVIDQPSVGNPKRFYRLVTPRL